MVSAHAYVTDLGDVNVQADDPMDPRGYNDVLIADIYDVTPIGAEAIAAQINRLIDAGVLTVNMSARYRTV